VSRVIQKSCSLVMAGIGIVYFHLGSVDEATYAVLLSILIHQWAVDDD